MKILHVITSMDPRRGGVSQAVRNLVLKNSICIHEVVCLDEEIADYGILDEFKTYKLGKGFTSLQYHRGLKTWLEYNILNYSHVVVHGLWQYHNLVTYRVHKKIKANNKPLLFIMPHGMLDPYFQKAKGRKLKAIRNSVMWHLTEKWTVNYASALLFTCMEEMSLAHQNFSGYSPKRELNVGLGVPSPPKNESVIQSAFFDTYKVDGPYWLFLSRLHPKKGIELLIQGYNSLSSKYDDIPTLVISGPLDDSYAMSMKDLAYDNKKVAFTGMIGGSAKWGAFYGCDAFILPSFQENFGIAIVEAMACFKPVVITRHVNIWREIIEGKGGIIIEDQTSSAVEKSLEYLLILSDDRKRYMGNNAHNTYKIHFDLERCAERFVLELAQVK